MATPEENKKKKQQKVEMEKKEETEAKDVLARIEGEYNSAKSLDEKKEAIDEGEEEISNELIEINKDKEEAISKADNKLPGSGENVRVALEGVNKEVGQVVEAKNKEIEEKELLEQIKTAKQNKEEISKNNETKRNQEPTKTLEDRESELVNAIEKLKGKINNGERINVSYIQNTFGFDKKTAHEILNNIKIEQDKTTEPTVVILDNHTQELNNLNKDQEKDKAELNQINKNLANTQAKMDEIANSIAELKKTGTKIEDDSTDQEQEESKENLEAKDFISKLNFENHLIEGFLDLNEAQKLQVINDLKQRIIERTKENSSIQYSKYLESKIKKSDKGILNKIKTGILNAKTNIQESLKKETTIKEIEKKFFDELISSKDRKLDILEDITNLTEIHKNRNIYLDKNNQPKIQFVGIEEANDFTKEEIKTFNEFNEIANEFRKIPYEWGQIEGKNKTKYETAKQAYEEARKKILKIKASKESIKGDATTEVIQIDNAVKLDQLINTHPEFEKEFINLGKDAGIKEQTKNIGNFLHTITGGKNTTNKVLFALGYGARATVKGVAALGSVTGLTLVATPIIGGVIGGAKGMLRGINTLEERKTKARHGVKDESKEATNTNDAEKLAEKIQYLIESYEQENSLQKKEVILDQLKRRLNFTEKKISSGLVNFGNSEEALNNQFDLINALNNGSVLAQSLEKSIRKDIDTRLEIYLSKLENKIDIKQKEYIKTQIKKGVLYGAGFATAGYMVRVVGEELGWFDNNEANLKINNNGKEIAVNENPDNIENLPKNKIPDQNNESNIVQDNSKVNQILLDKDSKPIAPQELENKKIIEPINNPEKTADQIDIKDIKPEAIIDGQNRTGITYAFRDQLRVDHELAKKLGIDTSKLNNPSYVAKITKEIAIKTGYMDSEGHEIRINKEGVDKVAYILGLDSEGKIEVKEINTENGKILDIHHEGDGLEKDLEGYEEAKLKKTYSEIQESYNKNEGLSGHEESYSNNEKTFDNNYLNGDDDSSYLENTYNNQTTRFGEIVNNTNIQEEAPEFYKFENIQTSPDWENLKENNLKDFFATGKINMSEEEVKVAESLRAFYKQALESSNNDKDFQDFVRNNPKLTIGEATNLYNDVIKEEGFTDDLKEKYHFYDWKDSLNRVEVKSETMQEMEKIAKENFKDKFNQNELKLVNRFYEKNLNLIIKEDKDLWYEYKDQSASKYLKTYKDDNGDFTNFLRDLKRVTGLEPNNGVKVFGLKTGLGHKEQLDEYIMRATMKAKLDGRLDEIDLFKKTTILEENQNNPDEMIPHKNQINQVQDKNYEYDDQMIPHKNIKK